MKYVDEYRIKEDIELFLKKIDEVTTREWTIMEVCGGQTHSIIKHGIDKLLNKKISLIHGPGCPVCVTPKEKIDNAIELAQRENVILCTFGDMLRVPGSGKSLEQVKASGADVRSLYSPIDAVKIATENPDKEIVFFAVGFETTAPANALAAVQAKALELKNFSMLVSHVLVPPAIEAIMSNPYTKVDAFLAAGHVCAIMGDSEYLPLVKKYKVPIVITGFEPLDIVQGIYWLIKQLEEGLFEVENQYTRTVRNDGNMEAQNIIKRVFQIDNRNWRGMGEIDSSGLSLSDEYQDLNAELKFHLNKNDLHQLPCEKCRSGEILQGLIRPNECPSFGSDCTPDNPLGATMVSSEGACHAYYLYRSEERT